MPSLLDPEDMADCDEEEGPDKFSVVTYVSQFYHLFKDSDDSRYSGVDFTRFQVEWSIALVPLSGAQRLLAFH